jgi:hypothetical protein
VGNGIGERLHDLGGGGFGGTALLDNPPDPSPVAIAAGVIKWHFIVPDDTVVEVGHVERSVTPETEVDRAEPGIVARDKVGLLDCDRSAALELNTVVVDARGDRIADKDMVVPRGAPDAAVEVADATDAGGAVGVLNHGGAEADPVVRLAEARVDRPAQELVNRGAMAIGAVEVAAAIKVEPERIDLSPAPDFNRRSVGPEAEDISGVQFKGRAIACHEVAGVVETVRGIDPAVGSEAEAGEHSVGVFFPAERTEENLAMIGLPVARGVSEVPDVGNAPRDATVLVFGLVPGKDAGGNIQSVREISDLVGFPVAIGILEDLDGVVAVADARTLRVDPAILLGSVGILDGGRDPDPATFVLREVDGFVDHGLRGKELDFKALCYLQLGVFLLWRKWRGLTDKNRIGARGDWERGENEQKRGKESLHQGMMGHEGMGCRSKLSFNC